MAGMLLVSVLALAAAGLPPFAGVWDSIVDGRPGMEIALSSREGEVAGSVVFYWQARNDGPALRFQARRAEEGPIEFRLSLTSVNEARLAADSAGRGLRPDAVLLRLRAEPHLGRPIDFEMTLSAPGRATLHSFAQDDLLHVTRLARREP
jgi:hypothetical protein